MDNKLIEKYINKAINDYKLTQKFRFLGDILKTKYGFPYYFKSLIKKENKVFSFNSLDNTYKQLYYDLIELIQLNLYDNEVSTFKPILKDTHLYISSKVITNYEIVILERVIERMKVSYETIGEFGTIRELRKALSDYKYYKRFRFLGHLFLDNNNIAYGFCDYFKNRILSYSFKQHILDELKKDLDNDFNVGFGFWYKTTDFGVEGFNLRIEHLNRTIRRLEKENFEKMIENLKGNKV